MPMALLASVLKINIGVTKIMYVKQKIKEIPPLQIGNDKLKPHFEWSGWLKLLVEKTFKITINW